MNEPVFETKNLPHGYAPAGVPAANTIGYRNREAAERENASSTEQNDVDQNDTGQAPGFTLSGTQGDPDPAASDNPATTDPNTSGDAASGAGNPTEPNPATSDGSATGDAAGGATTGNPGDSAAGQ